MKGLIIIPFLCCADDVSCIFGNADDGTGDADREAIYLMDNVLIFQMSYHIIHCNTMIIMKLYLYSRRILIFYL